METRQTFPRIMRGACSGMAATVPMTAAMLLIQRFLPTRSQERMEPRQIIDVLANQTSFGSRAGECDRGAAALVAHFGYGAAVGAFYPFVDRVCRGVPARGPAYGIALFALSYCGWLPALNILPPPTRRPRGRNLLLIASHLVWGATLQELYNQWEDAARIDHRRRERR